MIEQWLKQNLQDIIQHRRWLHQHPEIGFKEVKTSRFLQRLMKSYGYKINQTPEMITGFTCDYGDSTGPTLAIRCDMDGLYVQEANDVPYCSINDGLMHACGHDIHMSVILGVAKFLQDNAIQVNGNIRFIFQPAEEQAPGGAIAMINGGAIENVDHIIGAHVFPKLKAGTVGIKYGPMAATVQQIELNIKGPGGHTSRPAESVDLVWAQAHLIITLEEAIRHHLDQQDPVVLAFGKINGGHAFNVLPEEIKLEGTLRFLNSNLKDKLHQIIDDTVKSVSQFTEAEISWSIPYSSPGVTNDKEMTDMVMSSTKRAIGVENLEILSESSMGGEDFAYYLEHIPGAYVRIGSAMENSTDIHTPLFDSNELAIPTAITILQEFIHQYFS